MSMRAAIILLAMWWCLADTVHAQATVSACNGYVDRLPARIIAPGIWCLRRDLATSIPYGTAAIVVATDDVVLDCRGFSIRAMQEGIPHFTFGILADERSHVTVRACTVRGFWLGTYLEGRRGLTIEDNLVEDSTYAGMVARGKASVVRRNRVVDTGGEHDVQVTIGIQVSGGVDVLDNLVTGLSSPRAPVQRPVSLIGILATRNAGTVADNRIRQTSVDPRDRLYGIFALNMWERINIHDNDLIGPGVAGTGILCNARDALLGNNQVNGFTVTVDPFCTPTAARQATR